MFTRCPNCDTLFRVNAAMLAAAEGDVRCGRCNAEFNALAYLSDDQELTVVPIEQALAATQAPAVEHAATERVDIPEQPAATNPPPAEPAPERLATLEFDVPEIEWSEFFDDTHGLPAVESGAAEERPESGPDFEIRSLPDEEPVVAVDVAGDFSALDDETSDTDTWQAFLREVPLEEDEDTDAPVVVIEASPDPVIEAAAVPTPAPLLVLEADSRIAAAGIETVVPEIEPTPAPSPAVEPAAEPAAPAQAVESARRPAPASETADDAYPSVLEWGDKPDAERERRNDSGWWAVASLALLIVLGVQLLHANRDTLAIDPQLGAAVRELYGRLGLPLYPAWPLAAYEIRGAEAIAGRTAAGALDVVADIAMVGNQPAAAPLVRVVLRDRWSSVVGSRILKPAEYSRDARLRWKLLAPGSLVSVQFSLADPGASAQGYELDLCVPDRRNGLHCQLAHDPFRR